MNIFTAYINDIKFKQFKTLKDAINDIEIYKKDNKIEIILEEYNEFGHSDSKCNFFIIFI